MTENLEVFKRLKAYLHKANRVTNLAVQIKSVEDRDVLASFIEIDLGSVLLKNAHVTDFLVLTVSGWVLLTQEVFLATYSDF